MTNETLGGSPAAPETVLAAAFGIVDVWHGQDDNDPDGYWETLTPDEAASRALAALFAAGYALSWRDPVEAACLAGDAPQYREDPPTPAGGA